MREYIKMEISNKLKMFLADNYVKELINTSNWGPLFVQMYEFDSNIKDELIECIQLAGICSSDELRVYANAAKGEYHVNLWQNVLNNRKSYPNYTDAENWFKSTWDYIEEAQKITSSFYDEYIK